MTLVPKVFVALKAFDTFFNIFSQYFCEFLFNVYKNFTHILLSSYSIQYFICINITNRLASYRGMECISINRSLSYPLRSLG